MLLKTDKQALKHLISSDMGAVLRNLMELYCQKINNEPLNTGSEWETVKSSLLREGQIQGIRKLYQEMVNEADV